LHIPVPRGDNVENASSFRKRSLEDLSEGDAPNTFGNDSIAKRMANCNAMEKAAVCVDMWDLSDVFIQVVIEDDLGLNEMVWQLGCHNDVEDDNYYSNDDSSSDDASGNMDDAPSSDGNDDDTSSSGYSSMPGLIQHNNNEDSSDDESEEDEEMMMISTLDEYIIGGEDQAACLPGEPMEPPHGAVREEYMRQRQGYRKTVGLYLLYWMNREWTGPKKDVPSFNSNATWLTRQQMRPWEGRTSHFCTVS
jgi:hypothetical protein